VSEELYNAEPEEHAIWMWTYANLFAFVMTHITIWIQLCHVSKQKYQPFIKLFIFTLVALIVAGAASTQTESVDTRQTMLGVLAIVMVFQWIFIFVAMYEITSTLDISVFKTKQTVQRERDAKNAANPTTRDEDQKKDAPESSQAAAPAEAPKEELPAQSAEVVQPTNVEPVAQNQEAAAEQQPELIQAPEVDPEQPAALSPKEPQPDNTN